MNSFRTIISWILKPIVKFFILTFALSWACFISIAILADKTSPNDRSAPAIQQILILLGVVIPSFVAIWLSAKDGNPGSVRQLLRRILRWEVSIFLYIFALTFMPLLRLIASLIYTGLTDSWPIFNQPDWAMVVFSVIFTAWSQAGEEIGWRGFALPRMAKSMGLAMATIVLGALWALWHLPLFFARSADTFGQSFPAYFIQVTGLSVALGWLFWRSRGSLLLPMLMHSAINNTGGIIQAALPEPGNPFSFHASLLSWILAGLIWLCGGYFLWEMKGVREIE